MPTAHNDYTEEGGVCHAQRDATTQLEEFEGVCFDLVKRIFLIRLHQIFTLDDHLVGTRAKDMHAKTLCARKANREGHMAYVVADSLFRTIMAVRFRRRGGEQQKGACENIELLVRLTGQM